MIIVTGATGQLCRLIVQELLALMSADQIGVSVRDPAKATNLMARGIRVRRGDFDDPASLDGAFELATKVLIVSSNAAASGGDPLTQHSTAIAAAKAVGARRIVYTSHMGVSATSPFPPMRDHAATEDMLAGSGVAWTSLRNGFYASTVPRLIGDAAQSGVLAAPADGKVSWTTHADLAAAAARVLADEGRFDGPTPPLTAGEALDLADIAAILSKRTTRPIERRMIADEIYEAQLSGLGLPQPVIDITLGLFRASRAGEFEATDPALAMLLNRQRIMLVGYARVSTSDDRQSVDLQRDALAAAGVDDRHLHQDRASGARDDRPGLKACLADLRPGDVLIVWKLDRLGRSLPNLLDIITEIKTRGVGFRSLTEAMDTTTPQGELLFSIFGALAQYERALIRERVNAGLAAARRRGRRGGRPPALDLEKVEQITAALEAGASKASVCRSFRVARSTLIDTLKRVGWSGAGTDARQAEAKRTGAERAA